jgi:ribonuclease PH
VSAPPPTALGDTGAARADGRAPGDLRPVGIETGFVRTADGSVLASMGDTRVICTASLVNGVPAWRERSGAGWLTAEYGMLPASTGVRRQRDSTRGRPDGRTVEIQRLIGRSLRAVVDMDRLGQRTVYLDCDVLEADGGTRCASITGAYVALRLALEGLVRKGDLAELPLSTSVAAVSCGLVGGRPLLDLCYQEDSTADVDMNVVMTGDDELIELQATGEGVSFPRASLDELIDLAASGIERLRRAQEDAAGAGTS